MYYFIVFSNLLRCVGVKRALICVMQSSGCEDAVVNVKGVLVSLLSGTPSHHYLVFLISKSHIQDLNPTFGFQKPNLAFTNLIYKRALTRVLKKNNLGFKNQIWLFKLSFENQIFQLENRISKTTFIFKTHIWFMY